jgi:hypothetical protein
LRAGGEGARGEGDDSSHDASENWGLIAELIQFQVQNSAI